MKTDVLQSIDLVHAYDDRKSENRFVILTACYNKSKYIKDCVNSILRQTYRPLSVVWVDDCSRDDSLARLLSLVSKFRKANISISVAKSRERLHCGSCYYAATMLGKGSFYGVLDSDDALLPNATSIVADLYKNNRQVSYIWTQNRICDSTLAFKKLGISKVPPPGVSLLDFGMIHAFSHWRTFSNRIDKSLVFAPGLRSAVDKYMGYRLEELGIGMFLNKELYLYREGASGAITGTERTKISWSKIIAKAIRRRNKGKLKPYPIVVYRGGEF